MKQLQRLIALFAKAILLPFKLISWIFLFFTCTLPNRFGWRRFCLNQRESSDWVERLIQGDRKTRKQFGEYFKWHHKEVLFCFLLALLIAGVDKIQQFFLAFALDIKESQIPVGKFINAYLGNGLLIFWLCYIFWHKPKGSKLPAQVLGGIDRILRWLYFTIVQKTAKEYLTDPHATTDGLRKANLDYSKRYDNTINRWRLSVTASLPLLLTSAGLVLSIVKYEGMDFSDEKNIPAPRLLVDWMNNFPLMWLLVLTSTYLILAFLIQPRPIANASLRTHSHNLGYNIVVLIVMLLLIGVFLYAYHAMKHDWGFWCKFLTLGLLMYGPPLVTAHVFNSLSECMVKSDEILKPGNKGDKLYPLASRFKTAYDKMMWFSYLVAGLGLLLINRKDVTVLEAFSIWVFPLAMILFIAIIYYQALDWLSYNLSSAKFYTLAVILGLFLLKGPQEHYEIKYQAPSQTSNAFKRETLESYFLQWVKDRNEHGILDSQKTNSIFLVAAEGGGSRSGAWTSSVLTEIDSSTQGSFREKCFAISGVSGGSIGSAATLAWWDNALRLPDSTQNIYRDSSARARYINRIFGRNYISTALAGIFFYDGFQQNWLFSWLFTNKYSRTDRLQEEENDAVQRALADVFAKEDSKILSENYLQKTDFLELYFSQETGKLRFGLPLFFPNTCRVEEGRRGVSSAVILNDGQDSCSAKNPGNAGLMDILKEKERCENGELANKRLSLGEVTSLSELFPFVNSTVHFNKEVGTFMDGGVYENMGLTTLYEIRASLSAILASPDPDLIRKMFPDTVQQLAFRSLLKTIKFKFVLIYNSEHVDHEQNAVRPRTLQFFDPITTLLQTPFGGHTDYIYHKTKMDFGETDDFIEFPLITKKDYEKNRSRKPTDPIIMSRWLSNHELKQVLDRSRKQVGEKKEWLK